MTKDEMKKLLSSQQGELNAVAMYRVLADTVRDKKDAEVFRRLASDEGRHASVFKGLTGVELRPQNYLAVAVPLLYKLLGKKRVYPLIAKAEYGADKSYAPLAKRFPEVESVKKDEKKHGDAVSELLKS